MSTTNNILTNVPNKRLIRIYLKLRHPYTNSTNIMLTINPETLKCFPYPNHMTSLCNYQGQDAALLSRGYPNHTTTTNRMLRM